MVIDLLFEKMDRNFLIDQNNSLWSQKVLVFQVILLKNV